MLEAAQKMIDNEVDALPVVKELPGGRLKLIGKVTKTTLVRVLAGLVR